MIEELKEILTVIGQAPDMALKAFMMFGLYKLFVYISTTAGIYGVIRLGINRLHDLKTKEVALKEKEANKPKEIVYELKGLGLMDDAVASLEALIRGIERSKKNNHYSTYIHASDLKFLHDALIEKTREESKE